MQIHMLRRTRRQGKNHKNNFAKNVPHEIENMCDRTNHHALNFISFSKFTLVKWGNSIAFDDQQFYESFFCCPILPLWAREKEPRSRDGLKRKPAANLNMYRIAQKRPLYCRKKAYINHIVMSMNMNSSIYRWFIWGFWLRIITLSNGKRRLRTIINIKAYVGVRAHSVYLLSNLWMIAPHSIHNYGLIRFYMGHVCVCRVCGMAKWKTIESIGNEFVGKI